MLELDIQGQALRPAPIRWVVQHTVVEVGSQEMNF